MAISLTRAAPRVLSVRLGGAPAARLTADEVGRLSMAYEPSWLAQAGAYPLSIAMPLTEQPYQGRRPAAFFAGLLPETADHRERIARMFHVSAASDFSLLAAIGRDCAGAVTVLPEGTPVRLDVDVPEQFEALDEKALAQLVRDLPRRPLALDGEVRLSLAGVNDKTAVLIKGRQVGLAHGGYPTSHILKTDIAGLPDSIRTEFFCMRLAAEMGLKVPAVALLAAEDQHFMLVARYDRVRVSGPNGERIRRVHQEDFCQALGVIPGQKYEREGGPGWAQGFELARQTSEPALAAPELMHRAIFQYLVGNPDAHAKNYSLLHGRSRLRLAPLYDVNNAAAFRHLFKDVRPRMAMSIGGVFDPGALGGAAWQAFAQDVRLNPQYVRAELEAMALRIGDAAASLRDSLRGTPAWSPLLDLTVDDVAGRAAGVPAMLARPSVTIEPTRVQPGPGPSIS